MVTILAFLFVLGVLVFVHELGHFVVARLHGVRVITFSLGFGPKLIKIARGGTEYCISVVPLGGYVKLAGETVEDDRTGAPDEFLSKSKWVRFQVYLAGPIMNLLLALVVVAAVLSHGADVPLYESSAPKIGAVDPGSPAAAAGLRVGDLILAVDGNSVPTWDDLNMAVLPKANKELDIVALRDGTRVNVKVTPSSVSRYELGDLGIHPVFRPQIAQVNPGTPASRAGLQQGDVIVAVAGVRALTQEQIVDRIRHSANQPIKLTVERRGETIDVEPVPEGSMGSAIIGVAILPSETRRIDPTFLQAMQLSARQNWDNTVLIGKTLRGLFTRETPVHQLMGPVGIAELSGSAAAIGFGALLNLMAMISLNLGLLNLLPVPVLDGGHIAILAVEGLSRRELSMKVKERVLMAGAALIVLLMVTVIYNDIARLLR
jgi:regulator of sigma E protease